MSLKFCANLSFMFPESTTLLERYALAKRCGFAAVECAFPYDYTAEEVCEAKQRAGLEQVLINVYPGAAGQFGFAALPDRQAEFRDSLERAIGYAKALDCRLVHVMAGLVGAPTADHDDAYRRNLRYAAEQLRRERLVGVIEPICPQALPGYFMNSFDKAAAVVRDIDSPHLKLQVDLFHLQMLKGNLTANVKEYLPIIGHIQVAQAPGRHEPDSEGEINYRYVFKLLQQLGYAGWIGCEYHPATDAQSGLEWMRELVE